MPYAEADVVWQSQPGRASDVDVDPARSQAPTSYVDGGTASAEQSPRRGGLRPAPASRVAVERLVEHPRGAPAPRWPAASGDPRLASPSSHARVSHGRARSCRAGRGHRTGEGHPLGMPLRLDVRAKESACSTRCRAASRRVCTTSAYTIRVAAAPATTASTAAMPTRSAETTLTRTTTAAADRARLAATVTRTLRWVRRPPAIAGSLFFRVLRNPAGALEQQAGNRPARRPRSRHRPSGSPGPAEGRRPAG